MSDTPSFADTLATYKQAIDADIQGYGEYIRKTTAQQYGEFAELEVNTFLDILGRGGKRIRGALVMVGYEMCGGMDRAMIVQAARAIEMLHAYMLIIDDIQDRSPIRRGKPSAHALLADYHRLHDLRGSAKHAGMSLAVNAALAGAHAAQVILANLNADPQLRLNALSITNRTMGITVHGQTYDIMNELVAEPRMADIQRVLEWKTAQYSFINPLHVGMVLAGAGCEATDAITAYGLHMGRAFQIADDSLGIFGNEQEVGKSPLDDIREGKRTLLTLYALQHAQSADDRAFLGGCLGNAKLTQKEFQRCKQIIDASGARVYTQHLVDAETITAVESLGAGKGLWTEKGSVFLRKFAEAIRQRTS
jgi:geranylgeranyl diphosphate synthase, type I